MLTQNNDAQLKYLCMPISTDVMAIIPKDDLETRAFAALHLVVRV
jgi:hypothetical protein